MVEKRGLGRGLSALLGEEDAAAPVRKSAGATTGTPAPEPDRQSTDQLEVPIEFLEPNPFQPRRVFTEDDLAELTASIRERGIIQPIIVRPHPTAEGRFQIIAGERRWRSAQKAKLHEVPVRVKALDDAQALEIAIVENVQRADLNPVEEALGYRQLMDQFSYTQESMAHFIGKSRSHIANTLRLLGLPEGVQVMMADGRLSAGHGRAILNAEDPMALAKLIAKKGWSVRQAEARVRKESRAGKAQGKAMPPPAVKDADTRSLEKRISDAIGMRVEIEHKGEKGSVRIEYRTLDQLDDICRRLAK